MCVRLLVVMATTVSHIRHVGVREICHAVTIVSAHRGPAARAARVRIFRRRFSALWADTIYHSSVTTQTLRIPFTTRQQTISPTACSALTDGVCSSDSSTNLKPGGRGSPTANALAPYRSLKTSSQNSQFYPYKEFKSVTPSSHVSAF